jgi:hypothetical protein
LRWKKKSVALFAAKNGAIHPIAKERNSGNIMAEIRVELQVPFLGNCEKLFSEAHLLDREVS